MIALLLVCGLTTWRISALYLYDAGPFDMFVKIRSVAGVYEPGEVRGMAQLFSCMWCMSVWVGAGVAVASVAFVGPMGFATALPSSTIAVVIDKIVRKG